MKIPNSSFAKKNGVNDVHGRSWLFQRDFTESPQIAAWHESSDWDDIMYELVYCYWPQDGEPVTVNDVLIQGQLVVRVVQILQQRGFKLAALVSINKL